MRTSSNQAVTLERQLLHSRDAAQYPSFQAQQRASLAIQRTKKLMEIKNGKGNRKLLFSL